MKALKLICLALCAVCIVVAITGIQSLHYTTQAGISVTRLTNAERLYELCGAAVFAAAFYAIHKRVAAMWTIGWFVLLTGYVKSILVAASGLLDNAHPSSFAEFWLPIGLVVITGAAVCIG